MTISDKELLKKYEWIIVSENPLELTHRSNGGFATGMAAHQILNSYKTNEKQTCWCGNPIDYTNIDCATFGLCRDHASDS